MAVGMLDVRGKERVAPLHGESLQLLHEESVVLMGDKTLSVKHIGLLQAACTWLRAGRGGIERALVGGGRALRAPG